MVSSISQENEFDVSIIIVSFNTKRILNDCIHSIYKSKPGFTFEIIVVDNNSTDGSVEMLAKKYSKIEIIGNKTNTLFAKANNQAASIARGKYILLLNSDTIVQNGNLEKLVTFLNKCSVEVACVGPTVLNEDGTIQSEGFALSSIAERVTMCFKLRKILPRFIAHLILPVGTPGLTDKDHRVGWVSGCCMLIRRNIYLELGGLNEALEFYGEEPEFGFRLDKLGYETWVVTGAEIIHLGGCSTANVAANFLKDLDGRLYRYSQLQKFTVGYLYAIKMSQIVIVAARIKRFLVVSQKNKDFFDSAIEYEKKVVGYLKMCDKKQNSEKVNIKADNGLLSKEKID